MTCVLRYITSLSEEIPTDVVWIGMFLFCFISSYIFVKNGVNKGLKKSAGLLLIYYVLVLYCSTVFFRTIGKETGLNLIPLWSYVAYFKGEDDRLLGEKLMNIVVFVPVGLLAGVSFRGITWKKALVMGMCLSVGIEALQFVFKKGLSELDDVMHNTLGCVVGYGLFCYVRNLFKRYYIKVSI